MRLYDDEIRNWRSMCDRGIELPMAKIQSGRTPVRIR